jgi:hypothetical protein
VNDHQRKFQVPSISIAAMTCITATTMFSIPAFALNGAQYLEQTKVSLKQARQVALDA